MQTYDIYRDREKIGKYSNEHHQQLSGALMFEKEPVNAQSQ